MCTSRIVRVVVVVVGVLAAALGPSVPNASAVPDDAAVGADEVSVVVQFVDGDAVVFGSRSDRPTAAKGTGGGADTRVVHDGFATFGDPSLLAGYELRLVASPGIERVRPYVADAVADAGRVGPSLVVRGEPVRRMGPGRGQVDVVVSRSSPCGGAWLACGGPTIIDGVVDSGRIWVNPRLLERSRGEIRNTVGHELGHTLGLAHYDRAHEGALQVMHSTRFDATRYRSGDLAGIASNARGSTPVTIDEVGYAAGRLRVGGAVGRVPTGSRLRITVGDTEVTRATEHGRYGHEVPARGGRQPVCAAVEIDGAQLGRACTTANIPRMPFGVLESLRPGPLTIRADGWAIDPQTAEPIRVDLVVDRTAHIDTADRPRPDVAAVHPAYGERHGFRVTRYAVPGVHRACVVARDVGDGPDRVLGCAEVRVGGPATR